MRVCTYIYASVCVCVMSAADGNRERERGIECHSRGHEDQAVRALQALDDAPHLLPVVGVQPGGGLWGRREKKKT